MMSLSNKIKFSALDIIFVIFFAFNLYEGIKFGYWWGFIILTLGVIVGTIYSRYYKRSE